MLAGILATVILAPSALFGVAVDGPRVAYADTACRISVWHAGRTAHLGATPCTEQTSTGSGLAGLALAGNRALWATYTGGNVREWSLWTATTTAPRPRRLRFAAGDVDAPARMVVGDGDGDLLPYAVDAEVVVLRASGARRFAWTAPGPVTAVDALAGELAVASRGGLVTLLDGGGRVLRTERFRTDVYALQISGRSLVAQVGDTLDVRGGGGAATFALVPRLRLVGAGGGRALLLGRHGARTIDLDNGSGRYLGPARYARMDGSRVARGEIRRITVG